MSEETQIAQKQDTSEMPFYAHFAELRSRLIKSLAAVGVGAVACFSFSPALYALLARPLKDALSEPSQSLIFLSPVEPFFVYLKLSILSGIIVTLPFVFFQIWRFIAPGLYAHEKKALVPLVACSTVVFLLGAVFCYFGVLPLGLKALMAMGMTDDFSANAQISMASYYTLVIRLILAFGIVFEMPIFSYFLTRLGVITHLTLLHHWRIAVVLIFVIAAFLTPPDVITQVALGLPMCLLYVVSIWVARIAGRHHDAGDAASPEDA
ncbi:MAG: twin-arginine translocase subunit TatC [Proteobacteria bacterium]|nr:twin-arginine translocase subunit TatC [Pseudomonadota bacterium]